MELRELTDRYQLEKILKSTRFGTVLRAADARSGRTVAVKLITVASPARLTAGAPEFEALASSLAGMNHPNLPAVLDSGFSTDGAAFLAMELLEGKPLDAFAGSPPDQVLTRIGQALEGLEALAARGHAHLNLSPDNLFVAATPAGEQVKLLGLGTAVFRPHGAEAAGAGSENARYQAPEVSAGGEAGSRADVYSLALVICHALGATVGFGDSPVVQLPLSVSFELENDEALRQALERSLRQRPEQRPSRQEIREALRLALGAAAPAPPPEVRAASRPAAAPPSPPAPAPPAAPAGRVTPFPFPAPGRPAGAGPAPPPLLTSDPLAPLPPPVSMPAIPPAIAPGIGPAPPPSAAQAPPQLMEPPPAAGSGEPPQEGDVLSSVDDMLDALLNVPAPPPRAPGGAATQATPQTGARVVPFKKAPAPPVPVRATAASIPASPTPLLRRPAVLAAIAGVVVLGLLAGFWLYRRHQDQSVVEGVPEVALRQPPTRPPVDKLEEAKIYLAQGDDVRARRALRSIPWGEQGLLSPEGCRVLGSIQENLARAAFERLPSDLASGLKSGDLEVLESAVEAGAGQEAGLAPAVRLDYDRAKGAVAAYAQVRAASAQGDSIQTLERFAALIALLPKPTDPDDLRGQAAKAIETQAEKLVRDGQYAGAITRLAPVQRTWADRPGLKERLASYEKLKQDEARQEAILAAIPGYERHHKPWDGLQTMSGVEPTPHLAPQLAAARARLEDLLARLDKDPPKLVLRDGFQLDYARGTVVNLSFRATDDYEVKDVKLFARPEGGKFRELALDKSRAGYYTTEIQPGFHQNGTVDFYVLATDLSGHETDLGTRDKPMQLKRQQGFERILR